MLSDLAVGDAEQARLDVTPADGSTTVSLEVRPPSGTPYNVTMTGGDLVAIPGTAPVEYTQTWTSTAPVVYQAAGKYVLHFQVTGTGEGVEDHEVYVVASPVAGGPAWTPGRSRVAAYIPHRTLVRAPALTGNKDAYQFTFDSTTTPDGVVVERLIADSVAVVASRIAPMHASSEDLAGALAALRTAVWVERSWPKDDQSLQRANDMEKQFNTELAALIKANQAAVDDEQGTVDGFDVVFPQFSFPPADPRWDSANYW